MAATLAAPTVITTLRHGETEWGPLKRYAGSIDIPLSEKGREDCRAVAGILAGRRFDLVITSPLRRAIETAELVDHDAPMLQLPLCRERGFGAMEGLTWDEVLRLEPPLLFIEVGGDLHSVNAPGGEPLEDVWQRARRFRNLILRRHRGKRLLIVSHGVFLQMFHGVLRGSTCIESLANYPANLEIATFTFAGSRLISDEVERLEEPAGLDF